MAANTYTVSLADGRQVCFSYGVPVAAFIPGQGYVKTSDRFSVTTSRHANGFAGRQATELQPAAFAALIAPCEKGSR
jgi:hypothetical protein